MTQMKRSAASERALRLGVEVHLEKFARDGVMWSRETRGLTVVVDDEITPVDLSGSFDDAVAQLKAIGAVRCAGEGSSQQAPAVESGTGEQDSVRTPFH